MNTILDHKTRNAAEARAKRLAREATMALLDSTNAMGCREAVVAGVVEGILNTHRHLQSEGIRAILTALGEFGRLEGQADARNAHTKETCALLVERIADRIYWKD